MYGQSEKSAIELETFATPSIRKLFREDPLAEFSARKNRKFATSITSETRNQDGSISNILSCERFSQAMSYDHKFRKLRLFLRKILWHCDRVTL